jgi:hypothetical protein
MVVLVTGEKIGVNSALATRLGHGWLASVEHEHRFWRFRLDLLDTMP